jgi:hypothetical protein
MNRGRRSPRIAVALLAATTVLGGARGARAAETPRDPVAWHDEWARVRWWEVGITAGLFVSTYAFQNSLHPPAEANWKGPILLDEPIRGLFRARSAGAEKAAARYSDFLLQSAVVAPYVDAGLTLAIHQDPDVALQMALIDAESLGFAGAVSLFTERLVARQRPYVHDCHGDGSKVGNNPCGGDGDRISFFSGHASATFTFAGLTCIHHQHMPLWGGGAPDTWACVWALSLAGTTGALRVISDKHYASDVLTGTAVGLFSGYVLPALLHYGFGHDAPPARTSALGVLRPAILPVPSGAAAGVHGTF